MKKTVRLAGRISDWHDDKGFGFVEPNGGGERAFVHIKSFQRGSRRPVTGDLISYLPATDSRGRLQAQEVRHAGQTVATPRQPSRLPRAEIGLISLALIASAALSGMLAMFIAITFGLMSATSFSMCWLDKSAASKGTQRIPENTLHLADLLGGWPGALIAQHWFRHKTRKQSFQVIFWLTVGINLFGVAWLISSGNDDAIARWINR